MIRNSFIFLPRIGAATEQKLWQSGITNWNTFLENKNVPRFSQFRKLQANRLLEKARINLAEYNSQHFHKLLPNSETWRLYDHFKDDACFLDIETTGYYGDITVIGLYDGYDTKIMVKGKNLNILALKQELQKYKLILTFNGASFDLPVINKYYPNTIPNIPHIDLRHACAKLGLTGGLKKVEKCLNIKRAKEVSDMGGEQAVYLWQMYKSTGKSKYLDLLVQYNEEDIINLKPLADYAYKNLKEKFYKNKLQ